MLQVRQSAGLLLKNNLPKRYGSLAEEYRNYIKVRRRSLCGCSMATGAEDVATAYVCTRRPTRDELRCLQAALLPVLINPQRDLRRTAGTIASVLVTVGGGFKAWPGLVEGILQALDSQDANVLDGGLDTLYKVCGTCLADL